MPIIDCISDLHGVRPQLEGGDLLIVAGDLTARDTPRQNEQFNEWLTDQDYHKIILIGGNHDNYLEANQFDFANHIVYLCDNATEYDGLKIWGAPWTLKFDGMNPHCAAFTFDSYMEIKSKWDMMPDDIDILVTHGPPQNVLDAGFGDMVLYQKVKEIKPKIHIFGHIHEHGGKKKKTKHTTFYNVSVLDKWYKHVNPVTRIII